MRCPCLSGNVFDACCAPVLAGAAAPTAERLMRSRFTAFATGDRDYLLRSWHADTRPSELELDADTRWYRLDIEEISQGGPFDSEGTVTFEAFYRSPSDRGTLRERSRFARVDGFWQYVDGDILPSSR